MCLENKYYSLHFLSNYVDLISHHVSGPPVYDDAMTEQVSGPKEHKMLGQHKPSIPKLPSSGL